MGKNFNGTQINQSPTISEKAGADVADIRNLILKYDTDGNVVVAADGTAPLLGVSIMTFPVQTLEKLIKVKTLIS